MLINFDLVKYLNFVFVEIGIYKGYGIVVVLKLGFFKVYSIEVFLEFYYEFVVRF